MSSGDITRYVVTINLHEASLTELNELNNAFTRANFLLTLTDDEGNIHDLGTLTFGLIGALRRRGPCAGRQPGGKCDRQASRN
jgi:hypothetical protein